MSKTCSCPSGPKVYSLLVLNIYFDWIFKWSEFKKGDVGPTGPKGELGPHGEKGNKVFLLRTKKKYLR